MSDASEEFFSRLPGARWRVLMTDYDGTLAPFREQRDRAVPWPGVESALERIARQDRSRVVVVTGRSAGDIPRLMPLAGRFEIWGSHGAERRLPGGASRLEDVPDRVRDGLARARDRAADAGRTEGLEVKPAGVALHWRGRSADERAALEAWATEAWLPLAAQVDLELHAFDGGIELRIAGRTKADAVDAMFREHGGGSAIAYLGDDATDEDAFRAIRERGLGVLVRAEPRETLADEHLVPPDELLAFLERWADACGGK